ncbi:MAG: rod shape-determining protein MreD [Pseudomonadota bacterium]
MAGLGDALTPAPGTLWRVVLVLTLGLAAVLVEAAPVGLTPRGLPSPDLVFLVVAVVAVRRPDCVPILPVFALGLVRDLLTDLPTGLGALTLVLSAEVLRTQAAALARASLLREAAIIAVVCLVAMALQYVLTLAMLAQPPYVMAVVRQWLLTVLAWPLVLIVVRGIAGVRAETADGSRRRGA